MNTNAWLTLLAIVLGPTIGVVITLWVERSRRTKERRLQIVRMLLATRHMPADAQYNVAVNLIPADFNNQPAVMGAWRRYHEIVRERVDVPDHEKRLNAGQSAMIFQVIRSAGLQFSESDIQAQAYVSEGFVTRDNLYLDSLRAMPELAATLKKQHELMQKLVDRALAQPVNPSQGGIVKRSES